MFWLPCLFLLQAVAYRTSVLPMCLSIQLSSGQQALIPTSFGGRVLAREHSKSGRSHIRNRCKGRGVASYGPCLGTLETKPRTPRPFLGFGFGGQTI